MFWRRSVAGVALPVALQAFFAWVRLKNGDIIAKEATWTVCGSLALSALIMTFQEVFDSRGEVSK